MGILTVKELIMDKRKLTFSEFDSSDWQEWEQKLLKDLKGLGLKDKGLAIDASTTLPIAVHPDQAIPAGAIASSKQFPRMAQAPLELDNLSIMQLLMGGVDALQIEAQTTQDWNVLLAEVDLSFLDVNLSCDLGTVDDFLNYLKENNRSLNAGGNQGLSAKQEIRLFVKHGTAQPSWRFFHCACPAKEDAPVVIAALLEAAQQRMLLLDEAGQLENGVKAFSCTIPLGVNFLATIMMLRAARLVWALLLDSWQLDAHTPIYMQALPQLAHFGDTDPEKNMIRSTSVLASAILGGADNVLAAAVAGDSKKAEFYQRIARNNLHLFAQEGHLDWVNDPAAGSPYLEQGSNLIAEKAWDRFRSSQKKR